MRKKLTMTVKIAEPKKDVSNLSPEDLKQLVSFFEILIDIDKRVLITDYAKSMDEQKKLKSAELKAVKEIL